MRKVAKAKAMANFTRRFFRSLRLHVVLCRVCKPQLIVPHGKDTLSGVANLIGDAKSGIEQVSQCVRVPVCVCVSLGVGVHCFGLLCRRQRRLQTALHTHRRSAKFSLRLQLDLDLTEFKRAARSVLCFSFACSIVLIVLIALAKFDYVYSVNVGGLTPFRQA